MKLSRYYQNDILPDVKKIAVLRANAVGDFIFTLPALEALRNAYPEAEITLVGRDWHRDFLNGRPGPFDHVLAVPKEEVLRGSIDEDDDGSETEAFLEAMAAEHFGLAVQLYGGGRFSNPYILRWRARFTIGLKTPDAAPLDRWVPYFYFQSEVMRFLEVVSLAGADPVTLEPHFPLTDSDYAEAHPYLREPRGPLVALQPGAGDPRRRWPVEKFAQLGDALTQDGAQIIVTGADNDRDLVEGVVAAMHQPASSAYNSLSLGGLGALFTRCAVVIGNDTGPLHLAAAVGARTVPIYWCSNLLNSGTFTRAHHRPVVSWQVNCPECGANTLETPCTHSVSFVSNIPVQEVLNSARELMRQAEQLNENPG
jgi:ADP-heptose:LPS heptosyltransferase